MNRGIRMSETINKTIKSSQEQAVASWITYLNQIRLDELISKLNEQDLNMEKALEILNELKIDVNDIISSDRGGTKGIHGYLAEVLEAAFVNAEDAVKGENLEYTWVNNNGPVDLIRNGVDIQQKFVRAGGHFGLEAIKEHMTKYPSFLEEGGKYQIPKDFYEKLKFAVNMSKEDLDKYVQASNDDLSKRQIEWIRDFFEKNNISLDDIEPSVNTYGDVQKGKVSETIKDEENKIKDEDKKERQKAYDKSKPSLKEGAKVTVTSAAVEGGVAFGMSVAKKRKEKTFSDFNADDWKEIGIDTGVATAKGGVRGATVYVLSNYTATPSNVASAYVTAAFGIASQINSLQKGNVTKDDFVINCETVCLDVAISTIASLAGELLIPIPVLGAVIGNVVGQYVYEICKKQGDDKSSQIIAGYRSEMALLNQNLDMKYNHFLAELQQSMNRFKDLESLAFDENTNVSFGGSIKLALEIGVDENLLLKDLKQVDNYFLS